jgi:hypothetical protein
MTILLLIVHGLLAVALLGAITHQALALWRPATAGSDTFFTRLSNVRAGSYTNAVVLLYFTDFILGAWIYAAYRVDVRPYLDDVRDFVSAGTFETKEHLATLGFGLLPAYWLFWKVPSFNAHAKERKYITMILAFFVWWNFLIGHFVNNVHGLMQ